MELSLIFYIIILAVSFYILVWSCKILVVSLSFMARFLEVSEYVLAFVLMAVVTSLPEFFVGISSALSDKPQISLGNIIGANIINVTLAVALVAIFARAIKITSDESQRSSFVAAAIAMSPVIFILDGIISRTDGIILVSLFLIYIVYLIKKSRKDYKIYNSVSRDVKDLKDFFGNMGKFIAGLIVIFGSSAIIIWSVTNIAITLNFSLFIVGLILVAIGTTLPEITFGIRSVLSGKDSMAFGNVLGSTVANSALILGVVAILSPIHINNFKIVFSSLAMMSLSLITFALMVRYKKAITYKHGIILIFFYIIFLGLEFLLK